MATRDVWFARGVTKEARALGVVCPAARTGKTAVLATCKDKQYRSFVRSGGLACAFSCQAAINAFYNY